MVVYHKIFCGRTIHDLNPPIIFISECGDIKSYIKNINTNNQQTVSIIKLYETLFSYFVFYQI